MSQSMPGAGAVVSAYPGTRGSKKVREERAGRARIRGAIGSMYKFRRDPCQSLREGDAGWANEGAWERCRRRDYWTRGMPESGRLCSDTFRWEGSRASSVVEAI